MRLQQYWCVADVTENCLDVFFCTTRLSGWLIMDLILHSYTQTKLQMISRGDLPEQGVRDKAFCIHDNIIYKGLCPLHR